jgi:hypothetical protein
MYKQRHAAILHGWKVCGVLYEQSILRINRFIQRFLRKIGIQKDILANYNNNYIHGKSC